MVLWFASMQRTHALRLSGTILTDRLWYSGSPPSRGTTCAYHLEESKPIAHAAVVGHPTSRLCGVALIHRIARARALAWEGTAPVSDLPNDCWHGGSSSISE